MKCYLELNAQLPRSSHLNPYTSIRAAQCAMYIERSVIDYEQRWQQHSVIPRTSIQPEEIIIFGSLRMSIEWR